MEQEELINENAVKEPNAGNEVETADQGSTGETPRVPDETITPEPDKPEETPKVENLAEAVQGLFPHIDIKDDENLNGFVVNALNEFKNANDRLSEALNGNPEFAEILKQMLDGEDALSAMASVITPEEYREMYEMGGDKLKAAKESKSNRLKEIRDYETRFRENMQLSDNDVIAFQQETGKTDEEIDKILSVLQEINNAMNDGRITRRELGMIDSLINAGPNAEAAAEAAAISERNKSIDAKRVEDFGVSGDGLPDVATGAGVREQAENPLSGSLFDGVGRKPSIWERANMNFN